MGFRSGDVEHGGQDSAGFTFYIRPPHVPDDSAKAAAHARVALTSALQALVRLTQGQSGPASCTTGGRANKKGVATNNYNIL
jgi:hypothetical protein